VAFAWEGDKQDRVDIYIKQIGTERPLQVTQDFGYNFIPAWSPDGRYIAFVHANRDATPGIYIASALGGPPRKLRDLQHPQDCRLDLSWSPDGRFLAFSEKSSPNVPCSVYALALEDLQVRKLTSPPVPSTGDWSAEYSPDGKRIALIRSTKDVEDIYVMSSSGGDPHRLTFDNRLLAGVAWTPDSKEIIFSSNRGGASWGLWHIPVRGGAPERLGVGSDRAMMPTVSLKGHRLAYANEYWTESIWRIAIGPGHRAGKPEKLISSSMQEEGPQYSPDGKRIVFQSTRSGSYEIWRADVDGSNVVQLTSFGGPLTGTPRWSPDGRQIAFDSRPGAHPNIHVINADGGPVRRFTNDTSDDAVPSWSHDGHWIYFASNRSGTWQIWKMPADGGPPVQITKNGGFAAFESPDGKLLYYAKYDAPGLWSVPVPGGAETQILDSPPQAYWGYFAVASDGLYFAGGDEKHRPVINFYDFTSRKTTRVAEWEKEKGPYQAAPGMSVSADGRSVLYVQLDEARNNLMLAENFR
jgi:Tol biopolymer transport system component